MNAEVAPPLSDGRYRLVGVLGEGGMSTVYRAVDQRLGVQRAVKVLSPALSHHSSIRKRFDAEARTTARLIHPNIVNVHDVGLDNGRAFIVLELMTGGSLMSRLEALGPLPPRLASEVLQALLSALQYAHERGVIHRDVKPHNLLVDGDGVPKLTDFGIARLLTSDHGLTRTGAAIGTPAYMAPEQRGNASQVDARADVFGAGASLYTLLTGKEPFDIYAVELQSRLFAGIPEPLAEIIQRATRYEPAGRYASANAMLAELKRVHELLPENPEGTLPLGTPLPGRKVLLTQPTAAPELESQHTFHTPPPDGGGPGDLAAFPSLSGVEPAGRGLDIERSLTGDAPTPPPSWVESLRSRTFVGLLLLAVLMAGLVLALLSISSQRGADPGVSPAPVTPAPTPVSSPVVAPTPTPEPTAPTPPAPEGTDASGATSTPPEAPTGSTTGGSSASSTGTHKGTTPRSGETSSGGSSSSGGTSTSTTPTPTPVSPTGSTSPLKGMGSLTVNSKPRADLFINDVYTGRTRVTTTLQEGTYDLLIESDDGLRWSGRASVTAGQETRLCRDLKSDVECSTR